MSGAGAAESGSGIERMIAAGESAAPVVVSAREAALLLGVNERTIRRAIARGELAAAKRGRAFQITPAALEQYRPRGRASVPARRPPSLALPTLAGAVRPSPPAAHQILVALPRQTPTPLTMLPSPLTRFIGREREIAAVLALLRQRDVRLVTLIGPGGVGKTRLALRVAETARDGFADGVLFVSLAPLRDPTLVLPAIASALGLREAPDPPLAARLGAALRDRRLVLVLDNCEQLPDAATALADLLTACPSITMLATSRAPLRLSGERLFAIRPLALPGSAETAALDRLAGYEAIALFVERARHVRPDFALDAGNATAVEAICRRLDGLPLAIELAAAWLRMLSPASLLDRLERRLPLLTGGAADLPARLRTMRDAIAWSYDLLTTEEQRLFRRLAVFEGGFTLEAAEGVSLRSGGGSGFAASGGGSGFAASGGVAFGSGGEEHEREPRRSPSPPSPPEAEGRHPLSAATPPEPKAPPPSILALLAALVDKSLVQQTDGDAAEARYAMLETVREFALEALAERGEAAAVSEAHAKRYLALAETAADSAAGAGGGAWLPRLAAEEANLRAALDWLEQTGQSDAFLGMASALWHFWYRHGDLTEGRTRLERALAAASPTVSPAVRARALRGAGVLAWQGADYARSRQCLDEALAAYDALGDRAGVAWVRNGLGCLCATRADAAQAETFMSDALAVFHDLGDAVGITQLTANLGELAVGQGRYELASARLEHALTMWRGLGDRVGEARAQVFLGQALLAQDQTARAEAVLLDALAAIRDIGYEQILPAALRHVAHLAVRRDAAAEAARWLGAEARVRETLGMELPAAQRAGYAQTIAETHEALGEAEFRAAWEEGRSDPAGLVANALAARDETPTTVSGSPDGRRDGSAELSARERDVLRLLAQGRSDREIADALFVTRRTASKHVSAILGKLGVPSRTAAAAIAHRDRLV